MHQQQQLNLLLRSFLQRLNAEEELLHAALRVASDLYTALRNGGLASIKDLQPRQDQLATELRSAADRREAEKTRLGRMLGLEPERLTLSLLAKQLGEPWSTDILAARDRLSEITTQLSEFQQRNANLVHHLRSYFRSVLSALTRTAEAPIRYGASGACLTPTFGAAIKARG